MDAPRAMVREGKSRSMFRNVVAASAGDSWPSYICRAVPMGSAACGLTIGVRRSGAVHAARSGRARRIQRMGLTC
ncbi:MAG: hypothetical protein U5K74_03165 [Gemmatimonadaceae bacterium]|nr:hypothetical protein [Gemmatimonadaceae bacterium]